MEIQTATPCPNGCADAPQVTQDTWAILQQLIDDLQYYLNFILWLDQQLLAAQEMVDMDCDTLGATWRQMIIDDMHRIGTAMARQDDLRQTLYEEKGAGMS